MGYTTLHNMAQIGVGVSAISDLGTVTGKPKELDQYMEETVNDNSFHAGDSFWKKRTSSGEK